MRFTSSIAAGALAVGAAALDTQNYLGFNSGANKADTSAKFKADFAEEFKTAANLKGAPGKFNAVRLYTNIQAYSDEDPIEAFDAAVETDTKVLLGVWASGTDSIDKEISALKKAEQKYGKKLTDLVIGVNIGSEDLYRVSTTGIKNKSGVGNSPDAIVGFIDDWKKEFKSSPLGKIPIGHADTWDAWSNSTNKPVIDAIDFLSVHEYPYYETGKGNSIDNAGALFDRAYKATIAAADGKPVWVTETGWPYVGPDWDEAEATVKNAKKYWDEVGCRVLFNKTPTFWYTLRDSNPDNKMKFAITDDLSTTPYFDLKCPTHFDTDDKKDDKKDDDKDSSKDSDKDSNKDSGKDDKDSDDSNNAAKPTKSNSKGSSTTMTTAGSSATSDSGSSKDTSSSGSKSDSGSGSGTTSSDGASATETDSGDSGAASLKISAVAIVAMLGGALALF